VWAAPDHVAHAVDRFRTDARDVIDHGAQRRQVGVDVPHHRNSHARILRIAVLRGNPPSG